MANHATTSLLVWSLFAVGSATEFRLGIFSTECFSEYFENLNFLDVPCFKLTLSKVLGLSIISGAFLLKAPQIYNFVKSGSVEGVSLFSCYLDVIVYQNSIIYNTMEGYPLSTYGEGIVIYAQNVLIVLLMWKFSKPSIPMSQRFAVLASLLSLTMGTIYLLPSEQRALLPSCGIALTIWSRVPQIWTNFQNGHTGQLALATWVLNALGALARVFTTLQEVDDVLILSGFAAGAFLSFTIVVQILWYWKATQAKQKQA